ncbi:uncharacterized protein LOC143512228 [Brachyhypopomus gauderio]|uniref:uncharacterized protein LOC143512228 n=1 Tax=Brachyhypopomus gauderio TaxID=698409 RepID=UPI00404385F7
MFYSEGTEYTDRRRQLHSGVSDPEDALDFGLDTESGTENIKPSITKKLKFKSVVEGEATAFRCKLVARPTPTILWFHNNRQIQKEHRRRIQTVSKMNAYLTILTINDIKDKDSGSYKVMAINTEGSAESTASLLVSLREEQDANYFSLSRRSDRSHSSLDSLVDQTKERKFRVDLRCVGSPFDKTTKRQQRGHTRPKSAIFRTMYFRTASPSRTPDKGNLETASERARSPPPMFERHERFSDRYSDIYCDRNTGRDRFSDRFSDKLSDRCSDRYSDRFSDTDSLHGEVRAKLNLLQKAVKKKKRLSISTMSSSEFDLESVTSEPSYTDNMDRLRVKPSTLPEVPHTVRQGEQSEGILSKGSADFQSRLDRITGLGAQSVEPTQSRAKHSFEPQSRSRAIQMMRGELPLEDIKCKESKAEKYDITTETVVPKEESGKEVEYEILESRDDVNLEKWNEESKVQAKEPFVLHWLEAGEASKHVTATEEESTFKEPSRTKAVSDTFHTDDSLQNNGKMVPIQQLQPRAISVENILEKNLESECLESEDQFLAKRIRKWQEDVHLDQTETVTSEWSQARRSHVHKPEDKTHKVKPIPITQKDASFTIASSSSAREGHLIEHVAHRELTSSQGQVAFQRKGEMPSQEKEPFSHKPEGKIKQRELKAETQVSSSLAKGSLPYEQLTYSEVSSSPENILPKHESKHFVSEEETLTHPIKTWTQCHSQVVTPEWPEEKASYSHKTEEKILLPEPAMAKAQTDSSFTKVLRSSKEKRSEHATQSELYSLPEKMYELKRESVHLAGEEEYHTDTIRPEWSKDRASDFQKPEYEIHKKEQASLSERDSSFAKTSRSLFKENPSDHITQSEEHLKHRSERLVREQDILVQPPRTWKQSGTDTEEVSKSLRSENRISKKESALVTKKDSSVTKVLRSPKGKRLSECAPRRELHLSQEAINELKSESERYVSEEEALNQRIMKWQQDVLSEYEPGAHLEPDWAAVGQSAEKSTDEPIEKGQTLPKRTAKEKFFSDISGQEHRVDSSKTQQQQLGIISHEDSEKLRTESDYLVSEEEALTMRLKKWQQDILTEQEESVELESNWTTAETVQPSPLKNEAGLESTSTPALSSKYIGMASTTPDLEDKISPSVSGSNLPQQTVQKVSKSQYSAHEIDTWPGISKDVKHSRMESDIPEHRELLPKQESTTTLRKSAIGSALKSGEPVFVTTLLPNIEVRRGEMTELKCQFQGDPQPSVCWLKDGQPIIRDPDFDVRTRATSSTLTIYYPTNDHQGIFACDISNKYGKACTSCKLNVTDNEHKIWSETPQKVKIESVLSEEQILEEELKSFIDSGMDKKFTLQVPQAVIQVPHTSASSIHSSPVEIRITAPTPVLDITEEPTGTFQPTAKIPEAPHCESTPQTVKHKFTFSFDVGEAPQVVTELKNVSCSEGQTAILECIISGEPAPNVTWSHDDIFLDHNTGKYKFEENDKTYRLYIYNFTYADAGIYKFIATNKLGQAESVADVSFDSTTLDSGFSSLNTLEPDHQTKSLVASTVITPTVRVKTLPNPFTVTKQIAAKDEEESMRDEDTMKSQMRDVTSVIDTVKLQDLSKSDEHHVFQKSAPKVLTVKQAVPVISGCGLHSSGAEVKVSKLKQAFEAPESPTAEPDDITLQSTLQSSYPVEDIPEVALDIEQYGEGLIAQSCPRESDIKVSTDVSSLISDRSSPLRTTPDVSEAVFVDKTTYSIEEKSEKGKPFMEPASSDLHHFVSLAKVTEVQQSPTLIRPQAILGTKTRKLTDNTASPTIKVSAVEEVIKKVSEGAFVRPGGSHLEEVDGAGSATEISLETKANVVDLAVPPKTSMIRVQGSKMQYEDIPHIERGHSGTEIGALTEVSDVSKPITVKQKTEHEKYISSQDFIKESPQKQQQKAVKLGAAGIGKLEEEEVTFSAVYDYYNPPSDWGRPLSPESEMSIEMGSTFSEEIAEAERFYTPASSTEISQFPKSPESFHTSTETPGDIMTTPEYPFSPVEHKRPPSSSSDGLYSPAKFLQSPDDEGIETTPPMFSIDEGMILPEGRGLPSIGTLQEKVQGIPPAFLKPLTKRRVFEGDTLRFCAEVFGLPSPEVTWFRNKTQLVPDARSRIERDGDNIALEIQNITKADQGEYICQAFNYVGEAKSVALVVVLSQDVRMMPAPPAVTHQHVIEFDVEEDEDLSRSPSPQEILLEVELDENEVKEFEKQVKIVTIPEYTPDNKSMIISLDVLPSMYEEAAVDFITQESDDLKIAFELTEMPPRFINPICDIETPENTTVMFECSLMGIPSPVVSWYKGNMKIPHDKKKYFYCSDGDNHFLKVLKVNSHDSGIYTCRAINVVGETLCRASLMVLNPQVCSGKTRGRELTAVSLGSAKVQPQKFDLVVGNSSFDGDQTSEIELEFEFQQEADESQKAVRLVAMTDNEVSEQGEKYVSINFDVFAEPSKEDKIEFKGKSTNTCSFHFQVTETPPKCIIPLQNVSAAVGTPVLLQCLVSGKPNPTVEWFKDCAPITNSRYIIQEKASGHFNLLITNVAQSDAGEFKCVIQNKAGSTETMSLLKVF